MLPRHTLATFGSFVATVALLGCGGAVEITTGSTPRGCPRYQGGLWGWDETLIDVHVDGTDRLVRDGVPSDTELGLVDQASHDLGCSAAEIRVSFFGALLLPAAALLACGGASSTAPGPATASTAAPEQVSPAGPAGADDDPQAA
jgi:hypothetical protein